MRIFERLPGRVHAPHPPRKRLEGVLAGLPPKVAAPDPDCIPDGRRIGARSSAEAEPQDA
jgi:hypothetical protein